MRQSRFSKAQGQYCNDDKSTGRKERKMGQDVISFRLIFLFIQLRGGNMALITTRGDWKNSFDVFWKQSWEEYSKKYGRVFFLRYFQKHFESFWGQSLVKISKKACSSLFLGYGKGKRQVWGLEPTEFPIYQPITFFFLLKCFSSAQHKLDVSNANSLDLIGGCTFIT